MTRLVLVFLLLGFASLSVAQKRVAETETEKEGAKNYNQAIEAYSTGDYAKCIPLFSAADSLIGETGLVDRVKLRFALGMAYIKTDQPAAALEQFEWVAGKDSTYPYVFYQAAESARLLKQTDKSVKYYNKALETANDQDKAIILGKMARIEMGLGRLKPALKQINQAISLTRVSSYYFLRGQIVDRMAQLLDRAENDNFNYEEAIRNGRITEEKMLEATELRESALADYEIAAEDENLAATCQKLIERNKIIIENNRQVISEIIYLRENP
jgi:tetratricopeptide (TPR) repeat protein